MCKVLQIARSTFYHDTGIAAQKEQEKLTEEQKLKEKILVIFNENRQVYGTRKIKDALQKAGLTVSRRRIGRLMGELRNSIEICTSHPINQCLLHQMKSLFEMC